MRFLLALVLLPACAFATGEHPPREAQLSYLKALLLERGGAQAAALDAYEKALEKDPDSLQIATDAAELALELGQLERAEALAENLHKKSPADAEALALLGRVKWARGENETAEKLLREALKRDPKSGDTAFALAELVSQGSPQKARDLLRRFIEQNPESAAEAHLELGRLEMDEDNIPAAKRHFLDSIALSPDIESLPARYALAQAFENEQSTRAAIVEYEKILRLEPQNTALLSHIGQLYFMAGEADRMRDRFLQAKGTAPHDPTANHWLALDAEKRGEFSQAAAYLQDSAALPDDAALNLRLSYYLTQAGRLSEAVAALEKAHRSWPENDQVAYFLALGYDDLKKDEKAIELLRKVVALKPDYRDARYQLGVLLERKGRIGEAEEQFKTLLAERPDDAPVLNYLGYSLADRGLKLPEASELIRQALRVDARNGAYRDSLGWALHKQGRSTEAVAELGLALAALPDDETVWGHFGEAQLALGRRDQAFLAFQRARALKPEDAKLEKRAADAARGFDEDELGGLLLDGLQASQGGMKKLSGVGKLRGSILGREFSFDASATFAAPDDLRIELLGPLYTPLFRIRLAPEGFVMDPIKLEGVPSERVIDAAYQAVSLMRDYLSGAAFAERPAAHKKRWGKRAVESARWRLELDKGWTKASTIAAKDGKFELALKGFERAAGHDVPSVLEVSGPFFKLVLELEDAKFEFDAARR